MKISIIMPSYLGDYEGAAKDRVAKFKRAVLSFMDQRFPQAELVIVSDGCPYTEQALREIYPVPFDELLKGEDPLMKYVNLPKLCPFSGDVRNAGIAAATGDIIAYLDTDDVLLPGHLSALYQGFFRYPDQPGDYRRWVYFNDYVAGPDLQPIHERLTHLTYGGIGTGGFAHEKSLDVQWAAGYGHDWRVIQYLMQVCPHTKKIAGPRYLVCHLPPNIDV